MRFGIRMPRMLRRFIRRRMRPLEPEEARRLKQFSSIAYMLVAWNVAGYCAYRAITEDTNKKEGPLAELDNIPQSVILAYKIKSQNPNQIIYKGDFQWEVQPIDTKPMHELDERIKLWKEEKRLEKERMEDAEYE